MISWPPKVESMLCKTGSHICFTVSVVTLDSPYRGRLSMCLEESSRKIVVAVVGVVVLFAMIN
jgi:hypothetical protein